MASSPTIAHDGRRDAGAFLDAERHSRRVRLLRLAAPAAAALAVVATAVAALLQPLSGEVHVDTAGIGVGGPTVAMDAPRMRGFNGQNRAYEVSARTARQTIADPNRVGLDELQAEIELTDGGWARLSSKEGLYEADAQVLNLDQDVHVISDKGDDARLQSARAELKTGRIVSEKPVEILLGGSTLSADRMEVLDSGDRMLFSGRVKMTLKRGAASGEALRGAVDSVGSPGQ
ncbi:LPS export ABC transporter periplasmic protein LptC [Methylopila musalis]|uniref:LPS export ABC transporter periplasmic protein LptC n=1 Tax=Methylopila musalis TaxID=1134781 RepID=A0ABW3Z499_9HYPH